MMMIYARRLAASALLVFAGSVLLADSPQGGAPTFSHPGIILDFVKRTGVQATASAYRTKSLAKDDGCPEYNSPLVSARSDARGFFELKIAANDPKNYFVQYCQPGYFPRLVSDNSNSEDRSSVNGNPILLMRTSASMAAGHLEPKIQFKTALNRLLNDSTANLKYLKSADEASLNEALKLLAQDDRNLVASLLKRAEPPSASVRNLRGAIRVEQARSMTLEPAIVRAVALAPEPQRDVYVSAVKGVLDELTQHLKYLQTASDVFGAASESLGTDNSIIQLLLKRGVY